VYILTGKPVPSLTAVSMSYLLALKKKSYAAVKFAGKVKMMNTERSQKKTKKKERNEKV